MKRIEAVTRAALVGLAVNTVYAAYNFALGIAGSEVFLLALGVYHLILGAMRALAVTVDGRTALRFDGALLIALASVLFFAVFWSDRYGIADRYGLIPMLAIATFTTGKITLAVIGAVKAHKQRSYRAMAVRDIAMADALASLLTMQRSMLVSFEGMDVQNIRLMNALTGVAVVILTVLMGIQMLKGYHRKEKKMEKSKFVEVNEKIADTVVKGYKKVEETVVNDYKVVEDVVVEGYTKLEDAFVDRFLKKEGETVADAKARLKGENKEA